MLTVCRCEGTNPHQNLEKSAFYCPHCTEEETKESWLVQGNLKAVKDTEVPRRWVEAKTTGRAVRWRCPFQIPSRCPPTSSPWQNVLAWLAPQATRLLHLLPVCVINLGASSPTSVQREMVFLCSSTPVSFLWVGGMTRTIQTPFEGQIQIKPFLPGNQKERERHPCSFLLGHLL